MPVRNVPKIQMPECLVLMLFSPFNPDNLNWKPELVVVGNVCRKDHKEVLAAKEKKIKLTSFPRLLGKSILNNK